MISYNNEAPKAVNNVGQFGATEGSIGAYKSAAEYAADAKYWALLSQTKYSSVDEILAEVERLYAQGRLLEDDIKQLKNDFESQEQVLLGLIQSTGTAIDNTNAATELSKEATQNVLAQLDIISNMTVQTTLLPPGSLATGSYENTTGVFSFGIPEGKPGRDGTDGTISDIGSVPVGTPVVDDYGFYVDKDDGGLYRADMSDIANLIPSVRSVSVNGGVAQHGDVAISAVTSFNSRVGDIVPESGDYTVSQIAGAAKSGANSDITSLSGLSTALSVSQGGTGATSASGARTSLGLGSVSIESIVPITKGGTGSTSATEARGNLGLGLVATESIVPITKGGTGSTSADNARLALVAAKSGANSDITSFLNKVSFSQPVTVAPPVSSTDAVTKEYMESFEFKSKGDPRKYGAVGDGVVDDSDAVNAALQTGSLYIEAGTRYKLTRTLVFTGRVLIGGYGTLISGFKGTLGLPSFAIKVIDGSDSVISGSIEFTTSEVPYTIRRTSGWAVDGTWEKRFDGYIPTPQDLDIWDSIPADVKTHNQGIGTGVLFVTSGNVAGKNVNISGIRGNQVNIIVQGYQNSSISDIKAGLGQFSLGGIYFHNGVLREYNQNNLGYLLPRGLGNSVSNCEVKYSSLCGIVFTGNDKHYCFNNKSTHNAESGIKTSQYDAKEGISEIEEVMSTRGHYYGNYTAYNYYDGLDLQSIYGAGFKYVFGGHLIENNFSEFNRLTGMHTNSGYCRVSSNFANYCGDTGVAVSSTGNMVFGNKVTECCKAPSNPQAFQIAIQGDDCVSYGNSIKNATSYVTYDYIHTGLLGASPTLGHEGLDFGNYCEDGVSRIHISDSIPSQRYKIKAPVVSTQFSTSKPVSISGNYVVKDSDYSISAYTSSGAVVTLPDPATNVGRWLEFRNTSAYSILSSSFNIGPIVGGALSDTILPAVVGSWCRIQSDGVVWLVMSKG